MRIERLFAHKIWHRYITDSDKRTVVERHIRHEIRVRRQLLGANGRVLFGENRFRRHATREDAAGEQSGGRGRQYLTRKRIDIDILIHVIAQVMQINRQALRLRLAQRDIPVIKRTQIRLDILASHLQVVPLMLLVIPVHIADRHEKDIDEHRQHRREDDIHDSRRETHVADSAIVNQPDKTDQYHQPEKHMA